MSKNKDDEKQEKAQALYDECHKYLVMAEEIVSEIIKTEKDLDSPPLYILAQALELLAEYELMTPEEKEVYTELQLRVDSGELSLHEALEMTPKAIVNTKTEEDAAMQEKTNKKPLLN